MTPITRQDILAHPVPWAAPHQVEQDLLLCQSMAALFRDDFLSSQIAMRGGTLLHKVHLAPATRYSEDIDLVVVGDRPRDHIEKGIRRVLGDVLGPPVNSVWGQIKLAVRNLARPSEVLRMTYSVRSVIEPSRTLTIVVEANVTEREPHRPVVPLPFRFDFRGKPVEARIIGYELHEMLGTKMRALFQRRRGRDLFDLYWALTQSPTAVDPGAIISSFQHYLRQEGAIARRAEYVGRLEAHLQDRGFCSDMQALLRNGIHYDPRVAGEFVKAHLLNMLPE
jgi:predicted nucleotidyltransferase component of viral defense system